MSARDREYDRFGPWVLEISDEDPVPPLFEAHLEGREAAILAIKVPRRITRREAHPGMDLYDYVVGLYEGDILVLERVAGAGPGGDTRSRVRARTIAYDEVRHVSVHEELLAGVLRLGVAREPFALPYNAVSKDVMGRVVELIRARYRGAAGDAPAELPPLADLEGLSFYLDRLLAHEAAEGSRMRPLACQPGIALGPIESGSLHRLLFGLVDLRLLESVHLSDGLELRVVDRGRPYAYRWQTVYGRRETFIPLAHVQGADWAGGGTTRTLTVHTGGGDRTWVLTRDADGVSAYVDWLRARSPAGQPATR